MSDDARDDIEEEIQTWFDVNLDSGYISRFDIDLFHSAVVIEFRVNDLGGPYFHTVRFDGMRSIYFKDTRPIEAFEEARLEAEPEEWEIREGVVGTIEWLYAMFHQPGAYKVRVSEGAKGWISTNMESRPNFALDIMGDNGIVLIEANRLTLDNKVFEVGYPSESDKDSDVQNKTDISGPSAE